MNRDRSIWTFATALTLSVAFVGCETPVEPVPGTPATTGTGTDAMSTPAAPASDPGGMAAPATGAMDPAPDASAPAPAGDTPKVTEQPAEPTPTPTTKPGEVKKEEPPK